MSYPANGSALGGLCDPCQAPEGEWRRWSSSLVDGRGMGRLEDAGGPGGGDWGPKNGRFEDTGWGAHESKSPVNDRLEGIGRADAELGGP